MTREFILTPEQTGLLVERLRIEGKGGLTDTIVGSGDSVTTFFVGTVLPVSVQMHEFPLNLTTQVPALTGLKFVRLLDRILVVNPDERTVLAEVGL